MTEERNLTFSYKTKGELITFMVDLLDRLQNLQWSVEELLINFENDNRHNLCMGLLKFHEAYENIMEGFDIIDDVNFFEHIKAKPTSAREAKKNIRAAIKALNDDLD